MVSIRNPKSKMFSNRNPKCFQIETLNPKWKLTSYFNGFHFQCWNTTMPSNRNTWHPKRTVTTNEWTSSSTHPNTNTDEGRRNQIQTTDPGVEVVKDITVSKAHLAREGANTNTNPRKQYPFLLRHNQGKTRQKKNLCKRESNNKNIFSGTSFTIPGEIVH